MEENLFSYPAVLNLNGKRCAVIGGGAFKSSYLN